MSSRLILGDCLEILPTLEVGSVDAVVTDPPYPGLKGGLVHMGGGVAPAEQPTVTVGTPWGDNLNALALARIIVRFGALAFCSWHSVGRMSEVLGGEPVGLVTWYKRNAQMSFRNRPHYCCEYIWLIEYAPGLEWREIETLYDIPGLPAGCFASERILDGKRAAHPAQKPVELMRRLVRAVPHGATVLDPYMGTGTTGVACAQLGRDFIGIEIDPDYFAIAEKRIREAEAQLTLPLDTPKSITIQKELL